MITAIQLLAGLALLYYGAEFLVRGGSRIAFALGVTSVFAKKFASLAVEPPKWYESNYGTGNFSTLVMMDSLSDMMSSAKGSMTSSPSGSGSGGGSFSGGGGGGGGGGGSW